MFNPDSKKKSDFLDRATTKKQKSVSNISELGSQTVDYALTHKMKRRIKSGHHLHFQLFRLFPHPFNDVSQADDVVPFVVHRKPFKEVR